MRPEILRFSDLEAASFVLAQDVAGELTRLLADKDRATLIVPGGTTPARFFAHLGEAQLDWSRVMFLPTDERCVKPDDPRSNGRMIRAAFAPFREGKASYCSLHPQEGEIPEAAAIRLAADVTALPPPSILISGMGEDAHIASLFPHQFSLEANQSAILSIHPPGLEARLSLSAPYLAAIPFRAILMAGAKKRVKLDEALAGESSSAYPVHILLAGTTPLRVYWAEHG